MPSRLTFSRALDAGLFRGWSRILDGMRPAAAYSLRRLRTNYVSSLVRVRRSSDNVEADIGFTASGDLDLDALTLHCQAPRRPLDSVAGAAAYSTRLVRTAYTGPCMRVRRSSDNAELDIGFTAAGDLDTVTLLAFTGAGSGFVTTWYDQSGNARHATQATAANQPRIVNAGVVDTLNGRPTLRFDGVNDVLTNASALVAADTSYMFTIVYSSPQSATVVPFFTGVTAAGSGTGIGYNVLANVYNSFIWASAESTRTPLAANTPIIHTSRREAGVSLVSFVNGVAGSVAATPSANFGAGISIGAATNQFYLTGPISEVVGVNSALSTTDRENLERSQAAYFVITHASPVSGFVTTWYDQSGNARNATQPTAAIQPRIVNAGVVYTESGKPALEFLGTQRLVSASALPTGVSQFSGNAVAKITGGQYPRILSLSTSSNNDYDSATSCVVIYKPGPGAVGVSTFRALAERSAIGFTVSNQFVATTVYGPANATVYANGIAGSTSAYSAALGAVYIGIGAPAQTTIPNDYLIGSISEVTYFQSALSTTDRQTLERNQGTYIEVPVA